jgi:hypothetical protein
MRSRSFSRCKRAISAAWSADGSVACVVGRRDAAVGSSPAPRCSTHRRNTESRRPSSLATVREWQTRPLDPVYPVVFFDALRVKIRDEGMVKNKAVYVALALNPDGEKEVSYVGYFT